MTDRPPSDRLSALDVSFLYIESETTPMHVGGVAVFDAPPGGVRFDELVAVIDRRLRSAPRYRQKIRWVPAGLASPGWVDDPDFDVHRHVHRAVLAPPGSVTQFYDFVAGIQARALDRSRPLWEITVVEGLAGGGFAIVTKTHHAMVDGLGAADIAHVILDAEQDTTCPPIVDAEPHSSDLVADAVRQRAQRPDATFAGARGAAANLSAVARTFAQTSAGMASALRATWRPAPRSSLNPTIGARRRLAVARSRLDDYRAVSRGASCTVNDVVLATVTGALREWLSARGDTIDAATTVRALVPLSVRTGPAAELGNQLSMYFVDLPVGQPDPLRRLQHIAVAMDRVKRNRQSVGATAAIRVVGVAPAPVHALAARTVNALTRVLFNVVVSNVRGPQHPLYLAGARVREMVPVVPLAAGQGLSIGLLSYDGGVFYGLNADHETMPDVYMLASLIESELPSLVQLFGS